MFQPSNITYDFSMRFEADGMTFEEPNDQMFSFNSPAGACSECQGFGKIIGIDERLVIPNTTLSVYDGCVVCWNGVKMGEWKDWFCRHAAHNDFPIFEPYMNLTQQQKDWLWHEQWYLGWQCRDCDLHRFFKSGSLHRNSRLC